MKKILLITADKAAPEITIEGYDGEMSISLIESRHYRTGVCEYDNLNSTMAKQLCGVHKPDYLAISMALLGSQLEAIQKVANEYNCIVIEADDDNSTNYTIAVPKLVVV